MPHARRVLGPRLVAKAAALLCSLATVNAWAFDGEITSDTSAQFYDVRSPTGETVLDRRRLTTTLGLGAYNLLNTPMGDPKGADLSLRLRVRYDADFGAPSGTSDPGQPNAFVPGFTPGLVDLMYGYVEGRRFLSGWLGFKLGRQYVTDVLGWWSFDGAEASVTTPFYVKAEVYGGLEQRGGFPLSSSRFEGDGIWRGSRSSFNGDTLLYPAFQPAAIAPAVAVALESTGVSWLHARLTYRRVYDTGSSNVTEFANGINAPGGPYSGARISSEKLGYAIDATLSGIGGAKGGIVYDFYRAQVASAYAAIDAFAGSKVMVSADYDYYTPSFDGDSIWNFFDSEPRSNVGLRANVNATKTLSLSAEGHARIFTVDTATPVIAYTSGTLFYPNAHQFDEGGSLAVRWRTPTTRVLANGRGDFGPEGNRIGGDLSGEHVFETRYVVGGRAGVWHWKDDLQPDRETTGFQYVATLGYRFLPRCQGGVEWEHDINSLVGNRFRVLLTLNLGIAK